MAEAYHRLRSKLNRAVAAYLISVGAGGRQDVLPYSSLILKVYPNTTIWAIRSHVEVPLTGLRRLMVHVSVKGSGVQQVGEPNPEEARVTWDQRVAATQDALMQTADGITLHATALAITAAGRALAVPVDNSPAAAQFAANNVDMVDFTCQAWYDAGEGEGTADAEGCSWEEVLMFEALCSPSNVD